MIEGDVSASWIQFPSTMLLVSMPQTLSLKRPLIFALILGSSFGICLRLVAQLPVLSRHAGTAVVMTLAFLVLGPLAIGYITISTAELSSSRAVWQWITFPWIPVVVGTAASYVIHLEGWICIVFSLPITLGSSSIGGIIAGIVSRYKRRGRNTTLACIALLPILLAPLEVRLDRPIDFRRVETSIVIHADSETIWNNIKVVPAISSREFTPTWVNSIGFPRPIEATLSHEGVGGVRHARFEHGLLFVETVDEWQPRSVLGFSIHADTQQIPPTTLDEHVTIGGRYFDVLRGEYQLQPLSDGTTLLRLSSEERLSTDFNGYAGFWSDAVMRNIQTSILAVIKHRCEQRS